MWTMHDSAAIFWAILCRLLRHTRLHNICKKNIQVVRR